MVELLRRVARGWSQKLGRDWDELEAHLASSFREAFEPTLLIGPLLKSKDAQIKGEPASNECPDDSGQLVSHGGNGFWGTQFGA
jgi:hypothetical protein